MVEGFGKKVAGYLYHYPCSLFLFQAFAFRGAFLFFRLGGSCCFSFFLFFFFLDGVVIYLLVWLHLDLPPPI